jgi:PAS domain-containing protein
LLKNINAVVVSNYQGQVEWANKSFVEMSGYTMEIIGKSQVRFLQGPETDPETVAYLKDRISVGLPLIVKLLIIQNPAKSIGLVFKDKLYTTKTIKSYAILQSRKI